MIEEIRQASFNINDNDCDNDELATFQTTQNSLEIDHISGGISVSPHQSHISILRMNSSFVLPNISEDLGLESEQFEAISKPSLAVFIEKEPMWNRTACVWSSFIFFILFLLVGAISLSFIVWSNRQETTNKSFTSTSESHLHSLPTDVELTLQAPDIFCQNRSSVDFLSVLFTSGYDIMRTNPFQKNVYGRSLLEHTSLRECRLKQDTHRCKPNVESTVIDNLVSFRQWTQHRFIAFPYTEEGRYFNDSAIIGAVANANDDDLLNIQACLMTGNLIIMTRLNCPLFNTSRIHVPQMKSEYVERLRIMTNAITDDEQGLEELIEDFGAHYVDQVILGTEVIIRFTLERKVVDLFKRKNVSLVSHATATGLYILSRTNVHIDISKNHQKMAIDFMALAKPQIYSGSTISPPIFELQTTERWIQSALQNIVVISLQVKPIDYLLAHIFPNNIPTIQEKWWESRKRICSQIMSLELTGKCQINKNKNNSTSLPQHKNEQRSEDFVLPLLLIWTNRSTVCLRTSASWKNCLELCRNDPLCSAATICVATGTSTYQKSEGTKTSASCPPEFQTCDCALHRQQDFSYGIVSPKVVTLVPVRQDLRPVILRGFAVHGKPLFSVKQLPDLASCVRLCSRTSECKIVSFSFYDIGQQKICKLFSNMTDNELRRKGQATTLFIMATFSPCFSDEVELERSSCPTNANCSSVYGMCVCNPDFLKNGTTCISHNLQYRQNARKGNEYVNTTYQFSNKYRNLNLLNDDQQRTHSALLRELPIQSNTSISSNIVIFTTSSSRPTIANVDPGGPPGGELQTTTNKNLRHISNAEKNVTSKSKSTTPLNINPTTEGSLENIRNKSSYVPWQMRFWNRAT